MKNAMIKSLNTVFAAYNIGAVCVAANKHRHFVNYDVIIKTGCRVSNITKNLQEIALALRTKSEINVKVIPEQGIVRLQAVQGDRSTLFFEDLHNRAQSDLKGFLPFVLGETDEGANLCVDMSENPHLLVAGSTGSGKSVLLHNLIANAFKQSDTLLYLVDPKRVEFNVYGKYRSQGKSSVIQNITHDYNSTIQMLDRLTALMESRFSLMRQLGISDIKQRPDLFHKVMVIVDEVSDLMLADDSNKFENFLIRIAQKSRAAGIYLVLATQRPSVDVLTGLIKANFPARIACRTSSRVDSNVILDRSGAENLTGKGDAIFISPIHGDVRFQVAYVNPREKSMVA